jgi:hypothetical protein
MGSGIRGTHGFIAASSALDHRAPALREMSGAHESDGCSRPERRIRQADIRLSEMRQHRYQDCARPFEVRRDHPPGKQYRAADLSEHLTFLGIMMRVGMSCALTAVGAVGIFMIITLIAGVG